MTGSLSNAEMEYAVLGTILNDNRTIDIVSKHMSAEDFSLAVHTKLYEVIEAQINSGKSADPVTLANYIRLDLDDLGLPENYLAMLMGAAMPQSVIPDYADGLHQLSVRRQMRSIAEDLTWSLDKADIRTSPQELIDEITARFEACETRRTKRDAVPVGEVVHNRLIDIAAAYKSDGTIAGIPTGLADYDKATGGLHRSNHVVFAGRPGMGKTALATSIIVNCAEAGYKGMVASMEMSQADLSERLLSMKTGISTLNMRSGEITEDDYRALATATERLAELPISIDDTGRMNIDELLSRVRRRHRLDGLDILVIDYLQLMRGNGKRRGDSRAQELTDITAELKGLAKELNIVVISISQLSREVERRNPPRPILSDLRESGSIEQDADVVTFVYRVAKYLEEQGSPDDPDKKQKWIGMMDFWEHRASLIIAKQRHGPTGDVTVAFDPVRTLFFDDVKGSNG